MTKSFFVESVSADIGLIYFDCPGEKVNKLSTPIMEELDALLTDIRNKADWKAVIFASKKPGMFIAGADIKEIENVSSEDQGYRLAIKGQALFQRIAELPLIVVAAIDGACLGGGLELALACHYRVGSDGEKTLLGLPETKLGILPGFGGTQRLPKVVGIAKAVEMITAGKTLDGKKSYKAALLDELSHSENLIDKAVELIRNVQKMGASKYTKRRGTKGPMKWLERTPVLREVIFSMAKKAVLSQTKGQYPAPLLALEAIRAGANALFPKSGYETEARLLGKLIPSAVSKHLVHLFFLTEVAKKDSGLAHDGPKPTPRVVTQMGLLGAGVMGGGIAWLASSKKLYVRLKDINASALQKGLEHASGLFYKLVKQRRMTKEEFKRSMLRIQTTMDYEGFKSMDLVIEAVVEDMKIKKAVLTDVEKHMHPKALLVSNTSSLSINEMAGSLKFPDRFAGFHFFNPVHKMPLVEVIYGKQTSDETLVSLMELARKLGKTPVPVKDGPGFLVNRLLVPYMNEAAVILQEGGADALTIDKTMTRFGMPMGPITLIDEVGIDVGKKVIDILFHAFGARMKPANLIFDVAAAGWLGRKSGTGFYLNHGPKQQLNPDLGRIIGSTQEALQIKPTRIPAEDILDRMVLPMINEAAQCLDEKIVRNAGDVDLAMIFGTGFPPFKGGLLRYADTRGVKEIVERLNYLKTNYGERFKPCGYLLKLLERGESFYAAAGVLTHA